MPREYPTQCWSCLGEFDAASAIWCTCSAKSATKLCPFCFHCFCQADAEYREKFWDNAPAELREERDILQEAAGTTGEALIRSNLLSTDQLVSALRWRKNRGGTLEDAFVELGFVSRENLELIVKRQDPAPGNAIDLSKGLVDASLVKTVSVELCYRKRILPVAKEEIGEKTILTLAMAGPTDVETIDQVQSLTDCRVIPVTAPEQDILDRLRDLFPREFAAAVAGEVMKPPPPAPPPLVHKQPPSRVGSAPARAQTAEELLQEIEEEPEPVTPIPTHAAEPSPPLVAAKEAPGDEAPVLQAILAEAISKRTSLVQFEIRGRVLSLFFRIDGNLFRARPPAQATVDGIQRALNALASLPPGDRPAAGRFAVKTGDRRIDVVLRRFLSPAGASFLLKIIERSDFIRPLADLGPSALDLQRIRRLMALPHGLVVLSAPPHNGLETTRYSLMAELGEKKRRLLSIDSPQLCAIEGIRQEEVAFPADPAECRRVLTSVPGSEVVFMPEIASAELAALALELSQSCLVVAAAQARRASQVPAAILWHKVDPAALAAHLRLIVNQRLVRKLCESCRKPSPVTDRVLKIMGLTADEVLDLKVHQGNGCDACGTLSPGYAGRIALYEVLEGTTEIGALIAAGGSPGEIEREARRAGMSPLRAACLARVGQGITTLEEFQKGNF